MDLPWLHCLMVMMVFMVSSSEANCASNAVLFAFGDSNTDAGNRLSYRGDERANFPDGRKFFHTHTGRHCDGRLIIDYLCESLKIPYLSPYMKPLGSEFTHGANFAYAGSFAFSNTEGFLCFNIVQQAQLFLGFKAQSIDLANGMKGFIDQDGLGKALYLMDIGQNDISRNLLHNFSSEYVREQMPNSINEIQIAIQTLYDQGARKFWVHGTGPIGCLSSISGDPRVDKKDLDSNGCFTTANDLAKEFNLKLSALCDEMHSKLNRSTIVYTDVYSIKYDLIDNHAKLGFENTGSCLGFGKKPDCSIESRYISWDGTQYTEDANAIVAPKIFSGSYSKPNVPFDFFCKD